MSWNDDDDDLDDDESEGSYDDQEITIPCPHCGRDVVEDVAMCPYCENFIAAEDRTRSSRPLWITLTIILCLIMAIGWAIPW